MGYTIREITSGWSVIDYPEYFRDLDRAIYNAKEWSKESRKSMFFIRFRKFSGFISFKYFFFCLSLILFPFLEYYCTSIKPFDFVPRVSETVFVFLSFVPLLQTG